MIYEETIRNEIGEKDPNVNTICGSIEKKLEKIKTEEPQENIAEKVLLEGDDIPSMLPEECDKEK